MAFNLEQSFETLQMRHGPLFYAGHPFFSWPKLDGPDKPRHDG
jgi:hypothetical protein